jgi:RNA polymerase sigma-70 factor (ECF subfamily)
VIGTEQQDIDILRRLQLGDQGAFENIYRKYSPGLYGKLLRMLKSESQTEEIIQEVFIKIWEYRVSVDPEKSFRAFLYKIAENKVYDFFRRTTRDQKFKADLIAAAREHELVLGDFANDEEKSVRLQNAIRTLPSQRQQVFRLIKLERKSYKEVSELLGISMSTISDHIVKATKSVRGHLEKVKSILLSLLVILGLGS